LCEWDVDGEISGAAWWCGRDGGRSVWRGSVGAVVVLSGGVVVFFGCLCRDSR